MCNFDQICRRSSCFYWYLGFQERKHRVSSTAAGSQNGNTDLKISSNTLAVASLLSETYSSSSCWQDNTRLRRINYEQDQYMRTCSRNYIGWADKRSLRTKIKRKIKRNLPRKPPPTGIWVSCPKRDTKRCAMSAWPASQYSMGSLPRPKHIPMKQKQR